MSGLDTGSLILEPPRSLIGIPPHEKLGPSALERYLVRVHPLLLHDPHDPWSAETALAPPHGGPGPHLYAEDGSSPKGIVQCVLHLPPGGMLAPAHDLAVSRVPADHLCLIGRAHVREPFLPRVRRIPEILLFEFYGLSENIDDKGGKGWGTGEAWGFYSKEIYETRDLGTFLDDEIPHLGRNGIVEFGAVTREALDDSLRGNGGKECLCLFKELLHDPLGGSKVILVIDELSGGTDEDVPVDGGGKMDPEHPLVLRRDRIDHPADEVAHRLVQHEVFPSAWVDSEPIVPCHGRDPVSEEAGTVDDHGRFHGTSERGDRESI